MQKPQCPLQRRFRAGRDVKDDDAVKDAGNLDRITDNCRVVALRYRSAVPGNRSPRLSVSTRSAAELRYCISRPSCGHIAAGT